MIGNPLFIQLTNKLVGWIKRVKSSFFKALRARLAGLSKGPRGGLIPELVTLVRVQGKIYFT
jgi:hypothetical protein